MYKSMTKKQLCAIAGCSPKTFRIWMRKIEKDIPGYQPSQRLLTPIQVKRVMELLCLDEDDSA